MHQRIALFVILGLFGVFTAWQAPAQGTPPTILFHPTNRVSSIGGATTFIVTASGSNLVYRWRKEGIPLAYGTNRLLSLINLSNGNAGAYTVVVTNFYGSVTSQPALLTLTGAPPNIYLQPVDTTLCMSEANSILLVQAGGSPPFSYHWSRNGVVMPNSNTNRLAVPGISANLGEYFAVVSNSYGVQTSAVARLKLEPTILQQPASLTVREGSLVSFSVVAKTCSPPQYQWRWNGLDIPGYSTNADLYGYNPKKWYEGDYTVVVSDLFGSVTSAVARLEVVEYPPFITLQPEDVLDTGLPSALFQVHYTGASTTNIQWRFNGENLPGENAYYLSVPAIPANEGGYSVVVRNSGGSVTSRVALLTVRAIQPVIGIYGQPQSQILCASDTNHPNLFVSLYEQGLCFYQWWKDGVAMPGETNSVLLRPKSPESFGAYQVVVTNYFGAVTSEVATVSAGPLIVRQPPELIEADIGGAAYLSASVRACWPAQLQWQRNGVDVPGAYNTDLGLHSLSPADSGDYTLIVRQDSGSVTSTVARLEVIQRPPALEPDSGYPYDQEIRAGELVSFNLSSYDSGAPACAFQWWFNGAPIPGATGSYLEFTADSLRQQGRYFVVLSNEVGSVTSRVARLTLLFSLPYFDVEPEDLSLPVQGLNAYFQTYAYGAPPPAYQWLFNGTPLAGQTNDYLSFEFRAINQAGGYSVVASNFLGSVTSRVAMLTALLSPPAFLVEPVDQTVEAGGEVHLAASFTGSPSPHLQWLFNGVPIPGANNNILQFQAGFSNQIGGYSLVATNVLGAVTTRVAQVNLLLRPPQITQVTSYPELPRIVAGEDFWLALVVSNNLPVLVQWQRDGNDIPDATNGYFVVRMAVTNDAGDYRAIISNDMGAATSHVVRVEVRLPGPLDQWTWRRSLPQGNNLGKTAHGQGRHVAIGDSGALVISTDGHDWKDAHKPGHKQHRGELAFGNGVFVTIDGHGQPQFSTNGTDWINAAFPGRSALYSVIFGNGRFLAGPGDRTVAVSTNGADWEAVELDGAPLGVSEAFSDQWYLGAIHFAHDRFIALYTTLSPFFETGVAISTNGIDWQRATLTNPEDFFFESIYGVAHGAGVFVAVDGGTDQVLRSTNGLDWTLEWTETPLPFSQNAITYGNGRFVVAGYRYLDYARGSLAHSSDGLNWTMVDAITNTLEDVRFQDSLFVAVGLYGRLLTSTNGLDWTEHNPGSDLNIRGLTRAEGLFVAVGNEGLIYTSLDGRAWTRQGSGTNINLRAVTRFKDRFIAVGEQENIFPPNRVTILTSRDAIQWQPVPDSGTAVRGDFYSLAHNEHTIVAVGNGGVIAVSQDGLDWTTPLPWLTTRDLNAVTWSGNAFYAAGKDGTVLTSPDGSDWSSIGPGGGRNLHGIAYGNGVFVTVGNGGRYYIGTGDGLWLRQDWPTYEDFSDIIFAGGRFVAVGDNGIMFTSADGTNWTRRVNPSGNDLRSVIYSEGSYWVVGNNETILQSAQVDAFLRLLHNPGGALPVIRVLGEIGRTYRLQSSGNLQDWFDIQPVRISSERPVSLLTPPSTSTNRFFRLVTP